MPNLIITKNCNLNCDYCFAGNIYKYKRLEISSFLYLLYLKHLKLSLDKQIRLIGGEPLLHSNINFFLKLGIKGGFNILIFSNLVLHNNKVRKIFNNIKGDITINININKEKFYKEKELENINKNIEFLKKKKFKLKISYLVYEKLGNEELAFHLAKKYGIKDIHLKPYNYNGSVNYKTDTIKYGNLFYSIIDKYGSHFNINISCGFSSKILSINKQKYLMDNYGIKFKFGCYGNGGKYDIDYDGKIFRCFSLESHYNKYGFNLKKMYKLNSKNIRKMLNNIINTDNIGNCLGYKNNS